MKTNLRQFVGAAFAGVLLTTLCPISQAAVLQGEIAPEFTIIDRATGVEIRRDDFAGRIVLLDFFAYWCGPCRTSSPIIETDIGKYYSANGGNIHGVEVEVLGVNIERNSPSLTDEFIREVGFTRVADDLGFMDGAWRQFGTGYIPHFVIINGVSGGSHAQWEVLHSDSGFRGAQFYRDLIDSVQPPAQPKAPKIVVFQPAGTKLVNNLAKISFGTRVIGGKAASKTFVIKNKGTAKLRKLTISKDGPNPKDFAITRPSVTSLAPGQRTTFKVKFKPNRVGTREATIRIGSNDPKRKTFSVSVTGLGVKQ